MEFKIFCGIFALCTALFYSSDGTPMPGGSRSRKGEATNPRYSYEEQTLILKLVLENIESYDQSIWDKIAKAIKTNAKNKLQGFKKDRTPMGLRNFFFRMMMKGKTKVEVPLLIRRRFKNGPYSQAEKRLINQEIMYCTSNTFHHDAIWERIASKHDEKRNAHKPGFIYIRTPEALYVHFRTYMIPRNEVAEAVVRKFSTCRSFQHYRGDSSGTSSGVSQQYDTQSKAPVEMSASEYSSIFPVYDVSVQSDEDFDWVPMLEDFKRGVEGGEEDYDLLQDSWAVGSEDSE